MLGRIRLCFALQASGRSTVPVAAKRKRTEEDHTSRVSLAHGRFEHSAKEGNSRLGASEDVLSRNCRFAGQEIAQIVRDSLIICCNISSSVI